MPPAMLIDRLEGVRRRVRMLGVVFGLGLLLAASVAALLFTILVDYFLNLSPTPRLVVVAAGAIGIAYVLYRYILQPLWTRMTLSDVAGRLESAFPQFDDRLRSTVNFVRGEVPGSERMKDRVVTEATQLATSLNLNRAIVMSPVWYSAAAGTGAIVLAILLAVLVGDTYRDIAFSRLLRPFGGQAWPKRVQIEMIGAIPQRVAAGQRVDLKMKLAKGDRASMKSTLLYRYGQGPWQRELMSRGADGTYAVSLDARIESGKQRGTLEAKLLAGDDEALLPAIVILPKLTITSARATITPPKYVTGDGARDPIAVDLTSTPAVMPGGAEVTLTFGFNKSLAARAGTAADAPVKLIPLSEEAKLPAIAWTVDAGAKSVTGRWAATESLRFHVKATDTDGFSNAAIEEYELVVRPDQNPTVQIEEPRRNEERTPVASVPMQAVVEDDYGISSVKLVVDRLGDKQHWEVDLINTGGAAEGVTWNRIDGAGDRVRFRSNYIWELSQLKDANLKPGDVLEYHLLVKDNFALGDKTHEPVASGKLRINIISQEQLNDAIINQLRTISTQLTEIKNGQSRTKEETTALAQETGEKASLDEADQKAAERLAGQQGTAAAQTKQVAGKLDEVRTRLAENKSPAKELDELAREVRETVNTAAEKPMKDAAGDIGRAQQQPAKEPRNQAMASAVANQQQAVEQLQRALDRMGSIGSLQQTIDRIKEILKQQQELSKQTRDIGAANLGKTPAQMKPEDRAKLEKIASDQEQLSKRTEKALAEMQKTAESIKKSDASAAEAMSQAAKTGSQQQVAPNQAKAGASAKQNQQAAAQAAQKQAELGLEMVLNQLREAERRKLEELSKKLEELQNQIAMLIRRQAGHNLDNLRIQGSERILQTDAALLRELMIKAERPLPDDKVVKDSTTPAPEMAPYTASQEQTERNTRDIARAVEEVPDGAEPASHLTRAASRMERAIVALRTKKLPEAYDPAQIEALAALEEAKRIVDEQKKQIDDKRDEQQKEAVRAAYQRIKEAQEKLNGETARIDKARAGDGAVNRVDLVRLGQLPAEEGVLAGDVQKLDEALGAVGSIVYIWANKDIAESMGTVKDDLGKQVTGVVVQAEQTRIVEQLDAMIRNLAIKPAEKKFESKSGGGGTPGECTPGLPSEAELRLLKELQIAINKSTKTIHELPDKQANEPKLVALGTRQGEMRTLLDEMMKKTSGGKAELGPEPDPKEQLPEEVAKEDIENQELDSDLLNEKPEAERVTAEMNLVGDRMARSRQRLAINHDPGTTTQLIQERILIDLDKLIDQARKEQAQGTPQPKPGQPGKKGPPKPAIAQGANQGVKPGQPKPGGTTAAQQSQLTAGGDPNADLSQHIAETEREWGQISPRARDAAIEGANEEILDKYRKLSEDYYRGVATKGTERQ